MMTQEDKDLLLKDLCSRLPYGVEIQVKDWTTLDVELKVGHIQRLQNEDLELKPYLRPMSSMTEDEKKEFEDICTSTAKDRAHFVMEGSIDSNYMLEKFDWLNAHHFNYRLPEHLYIKVTKENNPYKI